MEPHDFGFSFWDEEEISAPITNFKTAPKDVEIQKLQGKIILLKNLINPFLENLKKNPDKLFLKLPDRVKKVEEFQKKISDIVDIYNDEDLSDILTSN